MTSNPDQTVRNLLISFLIERNAHVNMEDVLHDFPIQHINANIQGVDYTPWQLMEHVRITQLDIIRFIENSDYQAPKWPEEYWPAVKNGNEKTWKKSVQEFFKDLNHLQSIIKDPDRNLYEPMPAGEKYTLLREMLIVIDHNAHHLGQLVMFRKHFGAWR